MYIGGLNALMCNIQVHITITGEVAYLSDFFFIRSLDIQLSDCEWLGDIIQWFLWATYNNNSYPIFSVTVAFGVFYYSLNHYI